MKIQAINNLYSKGKSGLKQAKKATSQVVNNKYFSSGFWGFATVAEAAAAGVNAGQKETFNAVVWGSAALLAGLLCVQNLYKAIKNKQK